MKTLLLSSSGVRFPIVKRELLKILPNHPSKLSLCFIDTASKVASDDSFAKQDLAELKSMGFRVKVLDISGMTQQKLRQELIDQDIIYMEGGNGFYLLKQIKDSGFEKVLKELLQAGLIYVGVSAGTYVACPTIEMHDWKHVRDNKHGLSDLQAMNLVPFLITVHYNRQKYREKIKDGIAKTTYPVKILTDDQALLVKGDQVMLVGEGEEVRL